MAVKTNIEWIIGDTLTNKHLSHTAAQIEKVSMDLAKQNSFNGFSFQLSTIIYIAQKLKLPYSFGDDKMDSVGIDCIIGGVKVSIKPSTYTGSSCKQFYKNPTIFYEIDGNDVLINYDELIIMLHNKNLMKGIKNYENKNPRKKS